MVSQGWKELRENQAQLPFPNQIGFFSYELYLSQRRIKRKMCAYLCRKVIELFTL